jgi:hypothetical protein
MIIFANTVVWVTKRPRSPGHHLVAVGVGESMINSSVSLSKVAVVSSPATSDPCPISVYA